MWWSNKKITAGTHMTMLGAVKDHEGMITRRSATGKKKNKVTGIATREKAAPE